MVSQSADNSGSTDPIKALLAREALRNRYEDFSEEELLAILGRALCDAGTRPKAAVKLGEPLSSEDLQYDPWFGELTAGYFAEVVAESADFSTWTYGTSELHAAWSPMSVIQFFKSLLRLGETGLDWMKDAICSEMCVEDGTGLKASYRKILDEVGYRNQLVETARVVLLVISPQVGIPAVALPVAAWLLKVGLEKWCKECRN